MNGLAERAFTWATVNSDRPIDNDGAEVFNDVFGIYYANEDSNNPGGDASIVPFVITQALLWAKSNNSQYDSMLLTSYDSTDSAQGFSKLPKTENYFIKAWRGVARLAIVDVEDEITVEVPQFDPSDFSYVDEDGNEQAVAGVAQRIDLVFIYSKPVDSSSVTILNKDGKQTLTKPALGVVRGAGIKTNLQGSLNYSNMGLVAANDSILASPSDQVNSNMGFNSTSANDLTYDIRGSFPAPDDLLNLAPLISERLEDTAYELVGQSILPVAYVFVDGGSAVVLETDVIDIRPFFRTAELAYNERAGIAAAFPQLSLANPAVGKAQLDFEIKQVYDDLKNRIEINNSNVEETRTSVLATGYVFGGWYFGPEGALYDFYRKQFADDTNTTNDNLQYIRSYISSKYGVGSAGAQIAIPAYPDWDLAKWCVLQDISDKGLYPNDYINTFISENKIAQTDNSIVAGSYKGKYDSAIAEASNRMYTFTNAQAGNNDFSRVNFNYVSKKIKFNRPTWLADYKIDVDLVNCLPETHRGRVGAAAYTGIWVEKGFDEFTIYVAFVGPDNNKGGGLESDAIATLYSTFARVPAPHSTRTYVSLPGSNNNYFGTTTISERGGDRFSSFLVPVQDILYSNTSPIQSLTNIGAGQTPGSNPGAGVLAGSIGGSGYYVGNPRIGKCTYPTIMWSFTGIPSTDTAYLYGNLNQSNPTISLKG
jgi:hypothetical protein